MSHAPDLQPCLKVWVRVPVPAAACESSQPGDVAVEGIFPWEK